MANQVIIPRSSYGYDWGVKRRLVAALIEVGMTSADPSGVSLFIVPGHTYARGARGFGREYHPASLVLRKRRSLPRGSWDHDTLATGRITRDTIHQHADKINAAFGMEIASELDPSDTAYFKPKGD